MCFLHLYVSVFYLLGERRSGVIAEHMTVRQQAGLFDVSHMSELSLSGPDAVVNIQILLTSDISQMTDGQVKYCNSKDVVNLWYKLLEVGKEDGLIPCGLGARDTLRLEAGMPLYVHEMSDDISPKEAGLPCKLDGKDFIGRDAIIAGSSPTIIKRVGLKVTGRGIVREHCNIFNLDGKNIGTTTSGTFCPYLKTGVVMGYIKKSEFEEGKALEIAVRNRRIPVEIVPLPFYKNNR